MKLYNFKNWDRREVQCTEWDTDEVIFKKLLDQIKKDQIFIDVGAEYGYYAIKAGLKVGVNGKVLAIEAHPENYKLLNMNIQMYGLSNVVIPILKAVGGKTGSIELYETTSPGSSSIMPRFPPFYECNINKVRIWLNFIKDFHNFFKLIKKRFAPARLVIPMDTLDNIVRANNVKRVDLVKIDVEGAELDVLKGAKFTLAEYKPTLMVEVHFGFGWWPEDLYSLLRSFGYKLEIEKRLHKALVIAHA
jgi:FkbM family methyltransferase